MAGLMSAGHNGGPPLVLKFGGSSFADVDGFHRVARHVASRVRAEGCPAVVVVSAMSGTTHRLQQVLHEVNPAPAAEVAAAVLTTGETVSAALLTAALHLLGMPARAVPPTGVGFVAAGPADRALLEYVDPAPLRAALAVCPVLVLPGAQAVDSAGQAVMLGRNSSDLSAVAAAAAVGATTCEFYSDVPGICSADPYVVPEARTLPRVSYPTMRLMSRAGAKVLHDGAVAYAQDVGIRLLCCSMPPGSRCETVIGDGPPVAAVVLHRDGEVWGFPDGASRGAAADAVGAQGLDALPFDLDGGRFLVVSAGAHREVVERCAAAGRAHPGLRLLTTLHHDGRPEHTLVAPADAAAEVHRRHGLLYPDAGTAAPASPPGKARSAHSGMLVAAALRP